MNNLSDLQKSFVYCDKIFTQHDFGDNVIVWSKDKILYVYTYEDLINSHTGKKILPTTK